MSNDLTTADKFLILDALAKKVKAGADAMKAELAESMIPGERTAVSFTLPGESGPVVLGFVTKSSPAAKWVVTDPAALLAWVKEVHPDRVEMVPQVREWFVKSLLDNAGANGAAITDDGEIIPGIDLKEGSSYALPKPEKDIADKLTRLASAGAVSFTELLALEGGR